MPIQFSLTYLTHVCNISGLDKVLNNNCRLPINLNALVVYLSIIAITAVLNIWGPRGVRIGNKTCITHGSVVFGESFLPSSVSQFL